MLIKELLQEAIKLIEDLEFSNPNLEASLILAKILGQDRSYIHSYLDQSVSEDVVNEFMELINKRAEDYPLQYLLGHTEFMGLDFKVQEGVLIPRPDTEIMIEYIIRYINENFKNKDIKILDLCSGSGAIGLSLAHYCPNSQIKAVDIDEKALEISKRNKERLALTNIEFVQSNLFQNLQGENFHIIVSNPPYIRTEEIDGLQKSVRQYEPRIALDGGQDGLNFYREIIVEAKDYLYDGGLLVFEIGYDQYEDVEKILYSASFKEINYLKDLQGYKRVAIGFNN